MFERYRWSLWTRLGLLAMLAMLLAALQYQPASSVSGQTTMEKQAPLKVAEEASAAVSVSYAGSPSVTGQKIVSYPGASFIKLHFSKLVLLSGDFITVADPTGREVYTYHGEPLRGRLQSDSDYTSDGTAGFWALSISGDTAVVTLHQQSSERLSAREQAARGFAIDRYMRGFPEQQIAAEQEASILSICGADNRRNAVCYQSTRPTEYTRSRAVARLLIGGGSLCTGWRLTPNNFMMTNNHCTASQSGVSSTEVWFNYDCTTCTGTTVGSVTKVGGATFYTTDSSLDFTLFSVNNFSAISSFGYLELDPRTPQLNEEIYIPQHGGGRPKQLGIESDVNTGNVCRIDRAIQNGSGTNTDTGYKCDTIGGSSGSPVLARSSHKVIALHHLGGCPGNNSGALISLIYPKIQPYIGNPQPTATRTRTRTNTSTGPTATRTRTNTPGGPTATRTRTNTIGTGPTATRTRTNTSSTGTYPAWAPNVSYAIGARVSYAGRNYECIQAHTSLTGWEPPNTPALWRAL